MGATVFNNPTSVFGSSDPDVSQLLALVNSEGQSLAREFEWQYLQTQYLFTATTYSYTGTATNGSATLTGMSSIASLDTTFMVTGTGIPQDTFINTAPAGNSIVLNQACNATSTGTYVFSKTLFTPPTDFDRPIDRTQWDKSKHWEMLGPSTPQQQEWLRSGYISSGPRIRHWMKGGYFQIWPALGATESLGYEYISQNWILATGAVVTSKSRFSVDTDTCIFPDPLMDAMLKLKYFEIKGFDTTALNLRYQAQKDIAKANDNGSPTLNMAPRVTEVLIGYENLPDSNYGV